MVGVSGIGLATSDATWLGATDDRVAAVAVETYADFLRRVAAAIGLMAGVEWIGLAIVTLGLLQLFKTRRDHRPSRRLRVHATRFALALLVTLLFWGWAAGRHPGLFLGILATSRIAAMWSQACWLLAPIGAGASVVGYLVAASISSRRVQIAFVALAAVTGAVTGRCLSWSKAYLSEPFAIAKVDSEPKDGPTVFAMPPGSASASASASASSSASASGASGSAPPSGVAGVAKAKPNPPAAGTKPPRASNVLWIAVDSLRPDKIDATNTPNIAALLADSVYFPNTIVPVPRTGPSWTAALTSLGPLTSGIETMFPDKKRSDLSTVAMPAYLAEHGYHTMVVSEYAGEFFRRVKLGFETEAVPRAELQQISGQIMLSRTPLVLALTGLVYNAGPAWRSLLPGPIEELVRGLPNSSTPATLGDDVRAFLRQNEGPAFVLAFYSQPHFPYTSSPEYAKRYRVPGSSASLAYGRDVTSDAPIASAVDRSQVDALYRAALAESDAAIGKLLAELRKTHWLDDAIIVLTADHGEGLYECAECVGHGDNLKGMLTLRVPFAVHMPPRFGGAKPSVQNHYVSLLDVYPTITELLGLPLLSIMEGQAVLDATGAVVPPPPSPRVHVVETGEWLWTTSAVPKDRIEYPPVTTLARLEGDRISIDPKYEGVIRAAKHRAAIRAPYKLVYEPGRSGVKWRLFDFVADPLDTRDLAAEQPKVVAELKDLLQREVVRHARVLPVGEWFLTRPAGPPEEHW